MSESIANITFGTTSKPKRKKISLGKFAICLLVLVILLLILAIRFLYNRDFLFLPHEESVGVTYSEVGIKNILDVLGYQELETKPLLVFSISQNTPEVSELAKFQKINPDHSQPASFGCQWQKYSFGKDIIRLKVYLRLHDYQDRVPEGEREDIVNNAFASCLIDAFSTEGEDSESSSSLILNKIMETYQTGNGPLKIK